MYYEQTKKSLIQIYTTKGVYVLCVDATVTMAAGGSSFWFFCSAAAATAVTTTTGAAMAAATTADAEKSQSK